MRAVVGRIEDIGGHDVVHISLTGVLIPDGKGTLTNIPHMPFDRLAFEASIDTIVVENASADPQFEQGYEIWSSDRGGVFTISVPEAAHLAINMMMER